MCSTCCALGSVGEYRGLQFVVLTDAVSKPCGRLGREEKIILKCFEGRIIRSRFELLKMSFHIPLNE